MNSLANIFLISLTVLVTACASSGLQDVTESYTALFPGDHVLDKASAYDDTSWLPYRTCGFHFFEWADDSRQVAQAYRNFEYALMANNTYRNNPAIELFTIPRWTHKSRMESISGLGLDVYHRYDHNSSLVEIAIAYEGTNFTSIADWQYNFSLTTPAQFKEALEHAQTVRVTYPELPITVTGHSLGGGLALNISMHISNIRAVAFNSSPRAFFGSEDKSNGNERVHMYEVGEVLGPFSRTYLRGRLWGEKMLPVKYNFLDFTNLSQWVSEHTMYYFARGLMLTAIKGGSSNAAEAFIQNIGEARMDTDRLYCDAIKDMM